MKKCRTCGLDKPLDDFYICKQQKGRYVYHCKDCKKCVLFKIDREKKREEDRKKYSENRIQMCEKKRLWRQKNRKKCLKYEREWIGKNRHKIIESQKRWLGRNRHKVNENQRKRWAAKNSLIHPLSNNGKIAIIYASASSLGWCVDHIIPLAKGGWHHEDNLQILPTLINISKNANPFWEMSGYKSWRDVPVSLWPESLIKEYTKRSREIK